jgi:hypothetical protein
MALASLMGAIGVNGSDFGKDYAPPGSGDMVRGDERYYANSTFGRDFQFGRDFRFGRDEGDAGARWAARDAKTTMRRDLLEPNAGSELSVERYFMNINKDLTLNVASTFSESAQPSVVIRNQRMIVNAPTPGFVLINDVLLGNVNANASGTADAFSFSAQAVGVSLDLPLLQPANKLTVKGSYTGFVPPGFAPNTAYTLCITFVGPSTMNP